MSMTGKQWVLAIVGMIVVAPVAQFLGRSLGQMQNSTSVPSNRIEKVGRDTQVYVSKQGADGVSNDQASLEFAQAVGDWSLGRMRANTDRILREMGSSVDTSQMRQETVLVPSNGLNLIFTRIFIGDSNFALQVAGIQGNEMTRVLCMSPQVDQRVMLAGKCSDGLQKQFGLQLP